MDPCCGCSGRRSVTFRPSPAERSSSPPSREGWSLAALWQFQPLRRGISLRPRGSWLRRAGPFAAKPATREPFDGSSAPNLAIEPLGEHIDPDEHRQIGDPHVREVKLSVVDQHQPAVADRAIDQGPAQWSCDLVQVEEAWCFDSG